MQQNQFIHCQNTIFLIHVNTPIDNDNSFSLFDCLLNVLILTFSVCGISYYRWTTAMDFTYACVCVYSNSRNDVPRVAQRYGTIAAHTRRRASALVVFVVFCVHMHSFAGLIRRTPPPTFSDTAITDRHSDTTIFSSSELTGCGYLGLLDRKNRSDMYPRGESNRRLPALKASTLSTGPGSPRFYLQGLTLYL